jgi:hypothetical protein
VGQAATDQRALQSRNSKSDKESNNMFTKRQHYHQHEHRQPPPPPMPAVVGIVAPPWKETNNIMQLDDDDNDESSIRKHDCDKYAFVGPFQPHYLQQQQQQQLYQQQPLLRQHQQQAQTLYVYLSSLLQSKSLWASYSRFSLPFLFFFFLCIYSLPLLTLY